MQSNFMDFYDRSNVDVDLDNEESLVPKICFEGDIFSKKRNMMKNPI